MEPEGPLPFQDFFSGRQFPQDDATVIQIGSATSDNDRLRIGHVLLAETEETVIDEKGESSVRVRRRPVPKYELAVEWDKIALTEHENVVKQAMRIMRSHYCHGV